uniref:VWFD domain-containing protein n=1 Tax=Sander lucioperca TaxID=283035 RepID=A0A8C9Y5V0_SANLU
MLSPATDSIHDVIGLTRIWCFQLTSQWRVARLTLAVNYIYTCRTFGSGVVQPFSGSSFYVRSNCPFTLTRFTHNRVECDITTRRGDNGLLVRVEIIINKVRTVVQNGSILVEKKRPTVVLTFVSLPYDHTYQHIFHYGIYTKLKSSLLPLSVTWHDVPGGIDSLRVELEQKLSTDMTGLCGKHNVPGMTVKLPELIARLYYSNSNISRNTFSSIMAPQYSQLCQKNIYGYEMSKYIGCAFFNETWRRDTKCAEPSCSGDLVYVEQGAAFVPSCSNPNPGFSNQELTSSCVCPKGKVLNDHADGFHCVSVSSCPCVFAGRRYSPGDMRTSKCQSCVCDSGKWQCSENNCPPRCLIEGQFVTTFDGKQYALPGKCTYVASQVNIIPTTPPYNINQCCLFFMILTVLKKNNSLREMYTFSHDKVKFREEEITELHQSGKNCHHALVFWQSSMYVQVHTSFGMKIQVQVSPEIQLYITPPRNHTEVISGLCGNHNSDTTDDFTTSSRIIENSAQPFAQSWSVGACPENIHSTCISTDNEIFADEKCSVLNNPTGVFAPCHGYIPIDHYHTACIQRTCNCGSSLLQCLCVALGSYAKACANLGVVIGDWRTATNCSEFSFDKYTILLLLFVHFCDNDKSMIRYS